MGIDIHKLDDDVREDIAQHLGVESNDSLDKVDIFLKTSSVGETFEAWCNWNGFIGWSEKIAEAYENIKASEIKP